MNPTSDIKLFAFQAPSYPSLQYIMQSKTTGTHVETQTPDWSQNNDAYFAGSRELVPGAYKRPPSTGKPTPPGPTTQPTQTYADPVQFNEAKLETSINELPGFGSELVDTTGNDNFSYVWLKSGSAVPPASSTTHSTTTGSVWSAAISHITLVREKARSITEPARLKEGEKGTHLTIRGGPNNPKIPWGLHVDLPANSPAMRNHFLAVTPTNDADKSLANQFWANIKNGFKMRYGADFKDKDWQAFEVRLKADIAALLVEYAKLLKKLE